MKRKWFAVSGASGRLTNDCLSPLQQYQNHLPRRFGRRNLTVAVFVFLAGLSLSLCADRADANVPPTQQKTGPAQTPSHDQEDKNHKPGNTGQNPTNPPGGGGGGNGFENKDRVVWSTAAPPQQLRYPKQWYVYFTVTAGDKGIKGLEPIDSFGTTWNVPPPPATQSGQLVYLFNGLQNPGGTEILQPVLQWGVSGAGGGNFWSVASWHVDSQNQAYCTPAVGVNTGDVLTGIMTQTAVFSDGTHNYNCQFQGLADTSLMALGLTELTAAEQALEAYGITGIGDYPAAPCVKMSQIVIDAGRNQPAVTWQEATMRNPLYGEHTAVVSNSNPGGELDLFY